MTSTAELTKLLRQTHIASDDEILSAAESALKKSKGDVLAQHTRVVALLKLERYEDASRVFEESGSEELKTTASLEHAYALYRSGKLKDAAKATKEGTGRGFIHLAAQSVCQHLEARI
jgi:signal recognition particle subunit SRP72